MVHPVSAGSSRALASSAVDTTVPAPTTVTRVGRIERCDRGVPLVLDRGHCHASAHLVREPAEQSGERRAARADSGAQTTTRE